MEKIEFIPAAHRSLLKWAAAALVAIAVLSAGIGYWVRSATPVPSVNDEIRTNTDPSTQIGALNSTITEQDRIISDQSGTIDTLTAENTGLAGQNATLTEENAVLTEENASLIAANTDLTTQKNALAAEADDLRQQLAAYEEKYGTEFFVVFEIRRNGIIEESISMTVPVSREEYGRFQIGAQVANPEPYLSIPGDWLGAKWSITVLNKYQAQADTL